MANEFLQAIDSDLPSYRDILSVLPDYVAIIAVEPYGISAWAKTAKIDAICYDGSQKQYFLKCIPWKKSRNVIHGEYQSALQINQVVPGFVPEPVGCGQYNSPGGIVHFLLSQYHLMDLKTPVDPHKFIPKLAELHTQSVSPTGMFGFPISTACGILKRTTTWEKSWTKCFLNQLEDVIKYDNCANKPWPRYEAACRQIVDVIVPRLLDPLVIRPVLIHGDLWEQNIGIDLENQNIIIFDAGSTFAHNEMELATWRCSWTDYFRNPVYVELYHKIIPKSEPVEEWDDRQRLYSIHPYLNDAAGHLGSPSRAIAYNEMLYLIEKYAPIEGLDKYDPEKDISVTKKYIVHSTKAMKDEYLSKLA